MWHYKLNTEKYKTNNGVINLIKTKKQTVFLYSVISPGAEMQMLMHLLSFPSMKV